MSTTNASDETKSDFPLAGLAGDGWSSEDKATATCFCGAVQLSFPTTKPGLINTFVCNCTDCRKITASMFASNLTVADSHTTHIRGESNLKSFGQSRTIESGNTMTNYFCSTCGTLMYRISSGMPGIRFMRIGTVDDFHLHETKLRPQKEIFTRSRVGWWHGVEGAAQSEGQSAAVPQKL